VVAGDISTLRGTTSGELKIDGAVLPVRADSPKGVRGMWDLSLDPIPTMGYAKYETKKLGEANP